MAAGFPISDAIVDRQSRITQPWLERLSEVGDIQSELTANPLVDAKGLVTLAWLEHFTGLDVDLPVPVNDPVAEGEFVSLPWLEYFVRVSTP